MPTQEEFEKIQRYDQVCAQNIWLQEQIEEMSAENTQLKQEISRIQKEPDQYFEKSDVFQEFSGCISDLNLKL